jgi:hypothetical protein
MPADHLSYSERYDSSNRSLVSAVDAPSCCCPLLQAWCSCC